VRSCFSAYRRGPPTFPFSYTEQTCGFFELIRGEFPPRSWSGSAALSLLKSPPWAPDPFIYHPAFHKGLIWTPNTGMKETVTHYSPSSRLASFTSYLNFKSLSPRQFSIRLSNDSLSPSVHRAPTLNTCLFTTSTLSPCQGLPLQVEVFQIWCAPPSLVSSRFIGFFARTHALSPFLSLRNQVLF